MYGSNKIVYIYLYTGYYTKHRVWWCARLCVGCSNIPMSKGSLQTALGSSSLSPYFHVYIFRYVTAGSKVKNLLAEQFAFKKM